MLPHIINSMTTNVLQGTPSPARPPCSDDFCVTRSVCALIRLIMRTPLCGALQTATDYGPYIQNLPSPLHTTSIVEACTQLLVDQWHYLRANVRTILPSARRPPTYLPHSSPGIPVRGGVMHDPVMHKSNMKICDALGGSVTTKSVFASTVPICVLVSG